MEQELLQACIGAERVTSGRSGVSFMCAAPLQLPLEHVCKTHLQWGPAYRAFTSVI